MEKKKIFTFLKALCQNNSKEWMDMHRSEYQNAKAIWLDEVERILNRLARHNIAFETIDPKNSISRINNNRKFQPDKPIYKDRFSCAPRGGRILPSFYISIGPTGSYIGGGIYRPDNKVIGNIRTAIDHDAKAFLKAINNKRFVDFYGGLLKDDQMLKTAPKGYPKDHPHIDLLRRKNFIAKIDVTQKQVISNNFIDLIEKAYLALVPLIDCLEEAVTVEPQ